MRLSKSPSKLSFQPSNTSSIVQGQPILVDASGATVPVSAASLPLPDGAATEATLARANGALQDVGWTALMQADRIEDE